MASEASERVGAMAPEMGYQRHPGDKLQKLERQMGEQMVRMRELERSNQEQLQRNMNVEKQVDLLRREANVAQVSLFGRYSEERDTRQKELHDVLASIKTLEGKFDGMLREAVRDLSHAHQKGQQELRSSCDALQQQHADLAQHLGSRCQDLERFLREECDEIVQRCTERCSGLGGEVAEELRSSCDALQRQHGDLAQHLGSRCQDLERLLREESDEIARRCAGLGGDAAEELRSSCDALQRQHSDLAQHLGSRCQGLERLLREECNEIVRGCTRRCSGLGGEVAQECDLREKELQSLRVSITALEGKLDGMLREAAQQRHDDLVQGLGSRWKDLKHLVPEDLSSLMHAEHSELAARIERVEREFATHTHEITQVHKSSSPN